MVSSMTRYDSVWLCRRASQPASTAPPAISRTARAASAGRRSRDDGRRVGGGVFPRPRRPPGGGGLVMVMWAGASPLSTALTPRGDGSLPVKLYLLPAGCDADGTKYPNPGRMAGAITCESCDLVPQVVA